MNKKKRGLVIKRIFEPNRVSKNHLFDAYELLVPQTKYVFKTNEHFAGEIDALVKNKRIGENRS